MGNRRYSVSAQHDKAPLERINRIQKIKIMLFMIIYIVDLNIIMKLYSKVTRSHKTKTAVRNLTAVFKDIKLTL